MCFVGVQIQKHTQRCSYKHTTKNSYEKVFLFPQFASVNYKIWKSLKPMHLHLLWISAHFPSGIYVYIGLFCPFPFIVMQVISHLWQWQVTFCDPFLEAPTLVILYTFSCFIKKTCLIWRCSSLTNLKLGWCYSTGIISGVFACFQWLILLRIIKITSISLRAGSHITMVSCMTKRLTGGG